MVHIYTGPGNPRATKEQRRRVSEELRRNPRAQEVDVSKSGVTRSFDTRRRSVKDAEKAAKTQKQPETIRLGGQQDDTIRLGGDQGTDTSISAQLTRQQEIENMGLRILTSPKTTAVLAATLASLGATAYALAVKAASATTGVITHTVSAGGITQVAQRSFIGKGGSTIIDAIFKAAPRTASVAARYGSNAVSRGHTIGAGAKLGMSLAGAGLFVSAVGSYPFAGFINEEATQTLGFATRRALDNGDVEGARKAIEYQQEVLDSVPKWYKQIPYKNVLNQLEIFRKSAAIKLQVDRTALQLLETEGTFGEQIERAAEERRATKLKEREEDTAYFEQQRAESEARREEETERFEGIAEEAEARKVAELEWEQNYFQLIREGDYEAAEEMLKERSERGL